MAKCPICGKIARRIGESGDGIIFLECSNNHVSERKLTPRQWEAEIKRRLASRISESSDEAITREEKLRKRKERKKRENEVLLDFRTLYS